MKKTILFILAPISVGAIAQKSTITGTVTGMEEGGLTQLPFVSVVVKGTTNGVMTGLDGTYVLTVDPGTHVLTASYVGYEPFEMQVTVAVGGTATANMELKALNTVLTTFDVVAERRVDTETAVLMDVRNSEQVVSGMGRQQIAKSQDRTAGDVVKRIPGVTLVGDRFIMIRGLAERYNTVLLNGVPAPSLEADKRAFSFDLVPSGALDRIMIHKTGAAELPGDFAGGVIKVTTLGVPEENATRMHWSTSYRIGTTMQPFSVYEGSPTDPLGFDRTVRPLPDAFPASLDRVNDPEALAAHGRSLGNVWSTTSRTALPDQRGGLYLARRFGKPDGQVRYGTVNTVDYTNASAAWEVRNHNYNAYYAESGRHDTLYSFTDREYQRGYRVSVLSNWSALVGDRSKLEFRNLFNQLGESRATERTGRDLEAGSEVNNLALRWQERSIYSGQLLGHHDLRNDRTSLDWVLGYARSISREPDYRRVRTMRPLQATDGNDPFLIQIPPGASVNDAGRFFSDLTENGLTGRIDAEHTLGSGKGHLVARLRGGLMVDHKDRAFSARWMSFTKSSFTQFDQSLLALSPAEAFSDANINTTTGFKLVEGTNPSDRYDATNDLGAAYLGTSLAIGSTIDLSAGARVESNRQQLTSGTYTNGAVNVDRDEHVILPSVNASYDITERSLVRAAWSGTVNRPEFRELAPFNYYDFSTNTTLVGNPDLVSARVTNVDLRWEHYPSTSEVVSAGVFYKRFTDPIELFFMSVTGSGGARNFSYGNALGATTYGAEVEVRRSFSGLTTASVLRNLGVVLNGALIKSRVEIGESVIQKSERPMVGQSPYVANAGFFYEDKEHNAQFNVLWNVFGRRLYAAGSVTTPDIYEMPRHSLDVSFTKGLGAHFELKAGIQDLLNQRTRLVQDADDDGTIGMSDEEVMSFRKGSYFTAGIGFRF